MSSQELDLRSPPALGDEVSNNGHTASQHNRQLQCTVLSH
jgi:hypothetical protein